MRLLFDLDNTLTPPREAITSAMRDLILQICEKHEVGIITGSSYEYLVEQLGDMASMNLHLLPCNGTQQYNYVQEDIGNTRSWYWKCIRRKQMNEVTNITKLCKALQGYNWMISNQFEPVGDQIQRRDSLINLCPIGRNATSEQRANFVSFDQQEGWRAKQLTHIKRTAKKHGCVAVLGGQTSFDIYPDGWDKTYGLIYFNPHLYVGDAFMEGQNDFSLVGKVPCLWVKDHEQCFTVLNYLFGGEAP